MYPIDKNLPFYVSLLFFGVLRYYPMHVNSYNEKRFFWILAFWMVFWGGNVFGLGILFFINLINGNYDFISEDLAFFVGHMGCTLCCLFFALNHKKWSDIFESLNQHEKFGKPPKYDEVKRFGDKLAMCCAFYALVGVLGFAAIVLYDEDRCEKVYNGQRICAVLNPTWWPSKFKLDLISKRLILVYQTLAVFSLSCVLNTTFITLETCEFIGTRTDYLSIIFKEMCFLKDTQKQLRRFRLWMEYHQDTIRLCGNLNDVSKRTVGHLSLISAVVLACLGDQLLKDTTPKSAIYIVVYFALVFSTCHAGERLENHMMSIGDSVYLSEWYRCSIKIREMLPFVILRSHRRIGLTTLPFGRANYAFFLMVVKTSYSYLGLLNQAV